MKIALSVRNILVKVWQKNLTPKQACAVIIHRIILNCGNFYDGCDLCGIYKSRLRNLLNELKTHNINTTETEEDIQIFCNHLEKHKSRAHASTCC